MSTIRYFFMRKGLTGMGYGTKVLQKLLTYLRERHECYMVTVSWMPYLSAGRPDPYALATKFFSAKFRFKEPRELYDHLILRL